jgi:two-component system NtrC family sensor kinase
MDTKPATTLEDLIGIEHSKLGFFQELRAKVGELQKSNKESEDQRREISAILDGITDVMMVLSEDLRIISVNRVFSDLFPEERPVGKYCYEIFRHESHPCPECPAFRSLSTNTVCRETAIFKIGGRNMQFEMVASPLKNPEWPKHRVLIFKRDVTLEKEYQAKFYLAEKMATIGLLAAGVAHEVNNPLAAVAGFAEGIKRRLHRLDGQLEPEMAGDLAEYTETILKECRRCHDIVKTLLTFSRPVSGDFIPLSVNRVASETIRLIQHHMKKRPGLTLELDLDQRLPLIRGDEPQLKQVMLNLLTNALDAIADAGVIRIRTYARKGRGVFLEVRDTGCGIPPENMDKLFEPFFTTKPVGRGIGIGLANCYNIVKEHGGQIRVESEPGKGSTFGVQLPAEEE